MFKTLFDIMGKATLSITLQRTGANELTVGITPKSAGSELVPAVIVGSPEELDEKFAQSITGLVQDTENMILKKSAQNKSIKEAEKEKPKAEAAKPKVAEKVAEAVIAPEPAKVDVLELF
jgi:PRTRC genetic system protein E